MTLAEAIQADAINIVSDVPVTFYWDNVEYTGTRGALVEESPLQSGGFLDQPSLIISTSLKKRNEATRELEDRFPYESRPEVRDILIVDGLVYVIDRVTTDEHGSMIQMDLRGPNT